MQNATLISAAPRIQPPGVEQPADDLPARCPPDELRAYLASLTEAFGAPQYAGQAPAGTDGVLAEGVFDLLTSRPFSYLGRKKAALYRPGVLPSIRRDVDLGRPVRFYFDIGLGYHASTEPDERGIHFDVGLGELLALRQVALFTAVVRTVYPTGVRFRLVIDNLCGLYTNDVPLSHSEGFVHRLRALIERLGIGDTVGVVVESEALTLDDYERLWRTMNAPDPRSAGAAVVRDPGRTGVRRRRGARSRSRSGSRSTSQMMRACASPTRPSTRRCTCRAAVRYVVN